MQEKNEKSIIGSIGERFFYSLKGTVLTSFLIKFLIFLLGVVIIGFATTRTSLPVCGSSSGVLPPVYSAPYGDLEGYTDYRDLYLRCLVSPFLNGRSAYNLPIVYNYPPLFLYTLSLFAKLSNLIWSPALPIVAFDALTAIPVYLIAKEFLFKNSGDRASKLAFAVTLAFIANPINLFYNDLMWLNPGPSTFFLVLAVYLLLRGRLFESLLSLAVSTGFKQTSILALPIFIVAAWKSKGGISKSLICSILAYFGVLVVVSLPYLYQNPQQYFWSLQLPILGSPKNTGPLYPTTFVYNLSQPVRLTTFLGLIKVVNLQGFAGASYPVLNYVFIAFYVALVLYFAFIMKSKPSANQFLVFLLGTFLLFDALFGRGIYKYYFAGITPLALPFFKTKRNAVIFGVFSVVLILIPRIVDPWMAVLLFTFLPSLALEEEDYSERLPSTNSNDSTPTLSG